MTQHQSHTTPPNLFTLIAKAFFGGIWHGFVAVLYLVVLGVVRFLPHKFANFMMGNIMAMVGRFSGKTAIATQNLQWAYPDWDTPKRTATVRGVWRNLGYVLVDMMRATVCPKSVTIQGAEHYENALKQGGGVMLATPHLGAWEILPSVVRTLGYNKPNALYRRAKNPIFNWIMVKMRHKNTAHLLEKNDPQTPIAMMRLFKNNESLIILPDQKMNNGISVPFFGKPSMTATGVGVFAQKGVQIIPTQTIRHPNTTHYTIIFHPPLTAPKTGTKDQKTAQITTTLNATFENWITQNPDQYLWIHRRWDKGGYE